MEKNTLEFTPWEQEVIEWLGKIIEKHKWEISDKTAFIIEIWAFIYNDEKIPDIESNIIVLFELYKKYWDSDAMSILTRQILSGMVWQEELFQETFLSFVKAMLLEEIGGFREYLKEQLWEYWKDMIPEELL